MRRVVRSPRAAAFASSLVSSLVASLVAAAALTSACSGGTKEVKLRLPLRPKLAVTGRERISLAPFLVASKLSDKKDAPRYKDLDLDAEFRRYLGKQLGKRTKMTIVTMPPDVRLPSLNLKDLGEAADFWRGVGTRTGADILLTGVVDFRVENKSGYRAEEYRSPIDSRIYYRQVLVESTGFTFDVTIIAVDGHTGAKLFQENFRDTKEKNRRATDELVGLFENLFSLENQLLGLFVVREREANRYVFD